MALLVGQVVRVRVAVVLDSTDLSVGQVYDEDAAAWTDLVWVDIASSTALPLEFGDVDFWAEVYSLALTRNTVARPAVRLRAWRSGGVKADEFEILTSGSAYMNVAKLTQGGADVQTNLPGLGATLNKVRIRGMSPQRVGWTGRVPAALSWERSNFALRKRVKYGADSSYDSEYLSGVSGFAASHGDFNSWLGTNLPEYGSPITIGATLEFSRPQLSSSWSYRYKYAAVFTIHAYCIYDGSGWAWNASRGSLVRQTVTEVAVNPCGGRTGVQTFYGETYATTTANVAYLNAGPHQYGTLGGSFTTPAAGGGTITAAPRGALYSAGPSYGVDLTFTVNAKGRIAGFSVAGYSSDGTVESVSGWGACKTEGGYLV
jgi:hypothetical protein